MGEKNVFVYVLKKGNMLFDFRNKQFEKRNAKSSLCLSEFSLYKSVAIDFRNKFGGKIEKVKIVNKGVN